jgi:hypothetical protein
MGQGALPLGNTISAAGQRDFSQQYPHRMHGSEYLAFISHHPLIPSERMPWLQIRIRHGS